MNEDFFDLIRPYEDHEVQAMLKELSTEKDFLAGLHFVFPDVDMDHLLAKLAEIRSIYDFQGQIVAGALEKILEKTVSKLESIGMEVFKEGKSFLIISNHRDIVLDSALLNYDLFTHGLSTTRIAVGNNLLHKSWIEKVVRMNKNFIVHRDVQARQAYEYASGISAYIRKSIIHDRQSVWIAQREGRTKDGLDTTQAGLLKMLGLSSDAAGADAFIALNILPFSISYELEPCAGLKAREMYIRKKTGQYQKAPGEDLLSMKTGITQPKGEVILHAGKPLEENEIRECFEGRSRNDGLRDLATVIDKQIQANLALHPFNYFAADLMRSERKYVAYYGETTGDLFSQYAAKELSPWPEKEEMMPFLLQIYGNPVLKN